MTRGPSRAGFLAASGSVAALGASASASPGASPYDFAAVAARLGRPARHRQVFAVARLAGGTPLALVQHSLDAYELTRGEGAGALHPVAVCYSRGVVLGLADAVWRRYRLAEAVARRGDTLGGAQGDGNPFSAQLGALVRRGLTPLVCDTALEDWATYLVTVGGFNERPPEAIRADLRRALVPGALLVPAGVAALNDAQEARFTYVQASL